MFQYSRPRKLYFKLFCLIALASLLLSFAAPSAAKAAGPTPQPPPYSRITKTASKPMLAPGETLTYTIHLDIGPTTTPVVILADVSDPLPSGLEYVAGSANHDGVYDPALRMVTWKQVSLSAPVDLSFDVKDSAQVNKPTPVVNTATISFNGIVLQRQAWVTLMPAGPGDTPLSGSFKSAQPRVLGPGDQVTYAIRLLNRGAAALTVQVVDPVPGILTYVSGSASNDGVYDEATKTITWTNISVPPYNPLLPVEPVTLTFAAIAPQALPAASPIGLVVTNTAAISSGAIALTRSADVLLVDHPHSPLEGSYKTASQRAVQPGQEFSYLIELHNSSAVPVTAQVSDPLPVGVTYVDGSANANGVYDTASRTLSWSDVLVPEGATVELTFKVTANSPLAATTRITNTAAISAEGITFKRSVTVRLLQPNEDPIPPVVKSFVIGAEDVQNSQEVTLHIDASDNFGVTNMFLKEWLLVSTPYPHWQEIANSGWLPYQAEIPWKLSAQSGTHFMGVWVADAAHNRSHMTRSAIDFASLLLPGAEVSAGGLAPYMVYYPAGVDVKAELQTLSGAAHLFAWYPGSLFAPDAAGLVTSSDVQTITFTTPSAGLYLFLVYGLQNSTYTLSIAPAGGPRLPLPVPYASTSTSASSLAASSSQSTSSTLDGLSFNPILPQSGLDPLQSAADPDGPFQSFIPVARR